MISGDDPAQKKRAPLLRGAFSFVGKAASFPNLSRQRALPSETLIPLACLAEALA